MSYAWCKSSEEVFKSQFKKAMNSEYRNTSKKMKRLRSAFTTEQVTYLEKEFKKYPYIGNARRKDVAQMLNIAERAVKIWFQNRRMKEKKDTNSKEPEEKCLEVSYDQINKVPNKDSSLPLLAASNERSTEENQVPDTNKEIQMEPKCNSKYFEDISQDSDQVSVPKIKINPSVIKNNPASSFTSGEFSIDLFKKYKALKNEKLEGNEEVAQHNNQMREGHHQIRDFSYKEQQNYDYAQAISSATPQDLSAKSNFDIQRQKVENLNHDSNMKFSAPEVPVYLKGFYAQPYIPPGNMIWKPINVAPMIQTPIPAVSIGNSSITSQQSVKGNCNCDCHKTQPTSMFLHQNNHSPNFQYVITAVPFQNPKF